MTLVVAVSVMSINNDYVSVNSIIFWSNLDFSRRSSYDALGEGPRDSEVVVLKERFLIPTEPLRDGMLRFSFLLETCAPGSVPDPQLIAAVLDLVSNGM